MVHQYAYFALSSVQVSAAEITARLRVEPDVVQVVRIFECHDDEGADSTDSNKLLSWHLDARTLDFLRLTRAELDVDEYGY